MQCENHKDREATAICVSCGKPLCDECDTMFQGKHFCGNCGEEIRGKTSKGNKASGAHEINGFLWFLFSLMPGAGHMYMGLMKRGIMLLGIFLAVVALDNIIFGWSLIGAISVLIYVFAFFDSLSTKRALERGEYVEDEGIDQFSIKNINLYYVGIFIIVVGVISLINHNIHYLNLSPILWDIIHGIQRSILPIILIIAGVWLMKRSKGNK